MTQPLAATPVRFRPLTAGDLPAAHELSVAVKWPHRREDWEFALNLGAGVGAEDPSGLLGTALHWKFGADHASLGMVIVAPEQQGRGIGRDLMTRTMDALGERTTFLNATPAGQPLYEKFGFKAIGSIHQHQGTGGAHPPAVQLAPGERIRPLGARDPDRLAALLNRAAGYDRTQVLAALLNVAEGVVLDRDGEPVGFALMRRFGRGHVIGPLVAPHIEGAQALISHLVGSNPGKFVRIDVDGASGLSDWLDGLGLQQVDAVVTMVRGAAPQPEGTARVFAITNQALG
ncbi:GNAT family N-acetyltransferase [Paraburkholderia phenazinium]|uniref:Acetyltransferase (GNAT) domain-containing protein n=1 Tax=Paraburkholderia phenazinium TaxID=60549 RepID=A0A1G8GUZ0_9BURK|nr:GNAT family N-acetyltransferase [Paraburkholderia phenazinium]SDH98228.1 Acetyltransferase (GNAT) domain-containing protein [Paraburkholderia phenazinium]